MRRCLPATDIIEFEKSPDRIKQIIESAGTQMAALQYKDATTGEIKKIAYRLNLQKPCNFIVPWNPYKSAMPIYNANKLIRDTQGNKIGRGCWQVININEVIQVTVKGKRFKIQR